MRIDAEGKTYFVRTGEREERLRQQDRNEDTQPSSLLAKNWRCRELDSGLEQPKLSEACM